MSVLDSTCPKHRAEKIGRRIALAVGVIAEIIVATVGIYASGTIWLREHWLESIVGVMMWSLVPMPFEILCAGIVESRRTRRWVWTIFRLILFVIGMVFLIHCRINIDCYLHPIVLT